MLNHRQHINSLDGLRGLAVLMVFFHHMCPFTSGPFAALCTTLWLGVDLFFALSGFLITGVLYDSLSEPHYFRNFYARRVLRLMPVYIVVVAIALAVNAALGYRLTVWALPYVLYANNIVRDLRVPTGISPHLDLTHLWSLSVEEQFYFVWPVAVFLARTRSRIVALCLAGSALSVALRFIVEASPQHLFLGTPYIELPMRLDGLLLGGLLAMLLRGHRTAAVLTTQRLNAGFAIAVAALAASFAAAGHGTWASPTSVRYGYLAAAITFTVTIALALHRETWVGGLGNLRLLRMFGRYSYGLYLIHVVPTYWYFAALHAAQS